MSYCHYLLPVDISFYVQDSSTNQMLTFERNQSSKYIKTFLLNYTIYQKLFAIFFSAHGLTDRLIVSAIPFDPSHIGIGFGVFLTSLFCYCVRRCCCGKSSSKEETAAAAEPDVHYHEVRLRYTCMCTILHSYKSCC